ncbi:MAG: hypothetical protein HY805_05770 [Nitrospirae bacterium]|nr:hypothetical protein [Nitrospirota bacterium]
MNPNEIFTYPLECRTEKAKSAVKRYYCRFLENKCNKQSRTIDYPMGVCSVNYSKNKIIICPHRYLEDNLVFIEVCKNVFGSTDNTLLFSEVKLDNVGSFDFVLRQFNEEVQHLGLRRSYPKCLWRDDISNLIWKRGTG